jgi:predicted dienelactone hydrolase
MVRALFRAFPAPGRPPANVLSAKLHYPATYGGTPQENNTGLLPADRAGAPRPVAILMPGINVSPEGYGWLAAALAADGFVAVTYGWINEELPGMPALSPGLDVEALKPGAYGTRPSATALAPLLAGLAGENRDGPLAGLLDLDRVLLGGHSAGGSVALFNARPDWFAGLRAVFAYGAHSKASTMLGYPADTFLDLPDALPTLLLGGSEDGVIAASAFRYGGDGGAPDPVGPVAQTFERALRRSHGDCHLGIVEGANHFSFCWPADPATGRPFLDRPETRPGEAIRTDLAALVLAFGRAHCHGDARARARLEAMLVNRARVRLGATR